MEDPIGNSALDRVKVSRNQLEVTCHHPSNCNSNHPSSSSAFITRDNLLRTRLLLMQQRGVPRTRPVVNVLLLSSSSSSKGFLLNVVPLV